MLILFLFNTPKNLQAQARIPLDSIRATSLATGRAAHQNPPGTDQPDYLIPAIEDAKDNVE